jgi:hypothetical protein
MKICGIAFGDAILMAPHLEKMNKSWCGANHTNLKLQI